MGTHRIASLLCGAGLSVLLAAATESPAAAFDTGGHFIITQRALSAEGFSGSAIRAVQAATYLPDFWAQYPSWAAFSDGSVQKASNEAQYFHCDSLYNPERIEREMAWHAVAMKTVLARAKATRDVPAIIHVLGILTHATQDFYSHANFADVDWLAWKGTNFPVLSDLPREVWQNPLLATRWAEPDDVRGLLSGSSSAYQPKPVFARYTNFPSHGSATTPCTTEGGKACGVNHDNAQRRSNLAAHIIAAEATKELAHQVRETLDDAALWSEVTHYDGGAEAKDAWGFAQATSMAAGEWGSDGAGKSYIQLGIAIEQWACVSCPLMRWTGKGFSVLFALYDAAPPAHATGGGAPQVPAAGVPLFSLPVTSQATLPQFAGAYSISWGTKKGIMTLGTQGGGLSGTLTADGVRYTIVSAVLNGTGLDINVSDFNTPNNFISGKLFPVGFVGPKTGVELAGYMRDAQRGVPDGFHASSLRLAPAVAGNPGVRMQ